MESKPEKKKDKEQSDRLVLHEVMENERAQKINTEKIKILGDRIDELERSTIKKIKSDLIKEFNSTIDENFKKFSSNINEAWKKEKIIRSKKYISEDQFKILTDRVDGLEESKIQTESEDLNDIFKKYDAQLEKFETQLADSNGRLNQISEKETLSEILNIDAFKAGQKKNFDSIDKINSQIKNFYEQFIKIDDLNDIFKKYDEQLEKIETQLLDSDDKPNQTHEKENPSEVLNIDTFNTIQERANESINELRQYVSELISSFDERFTDEIQKCNQKLNELDTQLKDLKETMEVKPKVSTNGNSVNTEKKLPIDDIIDKAMTTEQKKMAEEQKILKEATEKHAHWIDLGKKMCSEITSLKNKLPEIVRENKDILDAFPDEISSGLNDRHEGLALIGRMFDRLDISQIESFILTPDTNEKIHLTTKGKWEELLSDIKTEDDADKIIIKHLKNQQMINFRIATKNKDASDKIEKRLTGFVASQIFPIIDGIYDGSKDIDHKKESLIQTHPGNDEKIKAWFDSYDHLKTQIVTMLEKINIHQMDINRGDSVNWSCHEAFSAEEDTELEDDTIKEIFRYGFEYETHDGEKQKLRNAQVVVVKNS